MTGIRPTGAAPIAGTSRLERKADAFGGTITETLVTLEKLSRASGDPGGWVSTGVVADAIGVSVGEAAARLRIATRQGPCVTRRSLRDGTRWKLTDARAALDAGPR